jgi:hypothetical protein
VIAADFAEFRQAGLARPLMDEVERALANGQATANLCDRASLIAVPHGGHWYFVAKEPFCGQ